jgi:hypothetical protein
MLSKKNAIVSSISLPNRTADGRCSVDSKNEKDYITAAVTSALCWHQQSWLAVRLVEIDGTFMQ